MTSTPRLGFSGYPRRSARAPGAALRTPQRGARLDAPVAGARVGDAGHVDLHSLGPPRAPGTSLGTGGHAPPLYAMGSGSFAGLGPHLHPMRASELPGGRLGGTSAGGHVFGSVCVCVCVGSPFDRGRERRLHFLPFPPRGHTHPAQLDA